MYFLSSNYLNQTEGRVTLAEAEVITNYLITELAGLGILSINKGSKDLSIKYLPEVERKIGKLLVKLKIHRTVWLPVDENGFRHVAAFVE